MTSPAFPRFTHRLRGGLFVTLLAGLIACASAQAGTELSEPLPGAAGLVFEEVDGFVAVEAEHFYKQTLTDTRAFYRITAGRQPDVEPNPSAPHVVGASGGAYLKVLPFTNARFLDGRVGMENFIFAGGRLAVLHYRIHFNTPGRYYVWIRSFSTGTEDNSIHVGLNGQWPSSGNSWQSWTKHRWHWASAQRTARNQAGEPHTLYLDIGKAGEHEILFSMRDDGFEFDKFILTHRRESFAPPPDDDPGPAPRLKAGTPPPPFPIPAGYVENHTPPAIPPGRADLLGLAMNSQDFPVEGTKFYRHRNRWLAIDAERDAEARTGAPFPHPSGRYDVTLHAVGEDDGMALYQVFINGRALPTWACPLGKDIVAEGPDYTRTWRGFEIKQGALIEVYAQVASMDGLEYSRARWIGLTFAPSEPWVAAQPALVTPRRADGDGSVRIEGELRQWHKVTLSLQGPYAHERDLHPNAFTDHRMTVEFAHESGTPRYQVPGYFAADGDASHTGAQAGTVWRAHLAPDKPGRWTYRVSFHQGSHVAVGGPEGRPLPAFHGKSGSFQIGASDKSGRDFRAHGRLTYVGKHHLRFAGSGKYFLKAGPDAPETFLAYEDFDDTYNVDGRQHGFTPLKTWAPHLHDWRPGDPTWRDGRGKGMIGALNYLAAKGLNAFSFIPYTAGGDGENVWPFVERETKFHYDCSKLDQWGIVFDHAQALGLYLHFKLQEQENDDNRWGRGRMLELLDTSLDGGLTGPERRLYLREMIARFGHALALNWNLGEENTQTPAEQRAMARFVRETDPYGHHMVIHSFPQDQDIVYPPLLGDQSELTGASLQNHWDIAHQRTLKWIRESAKAGKPWVVANDEQGPASFGAPPDPGYDGFGGRTVAGPNGYDLHDIRKRTLWGNLMAGGAGVEYYFGYQLPQNDLLAEDYRSRDRSWDYCRIAIEFFHREAIPFWDMTNANALVGNMKDENSRFCFAKAGEVYLVYLPDGGTAELDLSGVSGRFQVRWFNPREGGALAGGSVNTVQGGTKVALGAPPADPKEDWLAVVRR